MRRLRTGPLGDSELLLLPVEGTLGMWGGLLAPDDTGPLSLPTTPPPPGSG